MNASIPGLSCAAPLLALLLLAPSARAANKGHLVFSSPEGCASEAEFKAAVATRGGHFDDASATGNERALRVTIAKDESTFRGSFQTEAAEGASTVREVHLKLAQLHESLDQSGPAAAHYRQCALATLL